MSDGDYASFLDKANQGTGAGSEVTTQSKKFSTQSVDTAVPQALEEVEEYYTSDADEPFEPVALKFGGGEISACKSCPLSLPTNYCASTSYMVADDVCGI